MRDAAIFTEGFDTLLKKLKSLNTKELVEKTITKSMLQLEKEVKLNLSGKLVKVRTGRLRSSFSVKKGSDFWELGSNVSYAKLVEEGSKGSKGKGNRVGKYYFRTALSGFKEKLVSNLHSEIRKRL